MPDGNTYQYWDRDVPPEATPVDHCAKAKESAEGSSEQKPKSRKRTAKQ